MCRPAVSRRTPASRSFRRLFPGSQQRGSMRLRGTSRPRTRRAKTRREWGTWTRFAVNDFSAPTPTPLPAYSLSPAPSSIPGRRLLRLHENLGQSHAIPCPTRRSLAACRRRTRAVSCNLKTTISSLSERDPVSRFLPRRPLFEVRSVPFSFPSTTKLSSLRSSASLLLAARPRKPSTKSAARTRGPSRHLSGDAPRHPPPPACVRYTRQSPLSSTSGR